MIALADQRKVKPKQGDFTQAFCQSTLPKGEQYICSPPYKCPITPSKTYLLLKKTLYGLKRSPKHWYNKATSAFKSIGLKQCINAPCLFSGKILENEPWLFLGLYEDDFIYYSQSPKVENAFEDKLKLLLDVEFEKNTQNFLGQKIQVHEEENHMNIFLSQQSTTEELIHKAGLSEVSS